MLPFAWKDGKRQDRQGGIDFRKKPAALGFFVGSDGQDLARRKIERPVCFFDEPFSYSDG